jgi:hypothetical protein
MFRQETCDAGGRYPTGEGSGTPGIWPSDGLPRSSAEQTTASGNDPEPSP